MTGNQAPAPHPVRPEAGDAGLPTMAEQWARYDADRAAWRQAMDAWSNGGEIGKPPPMPVRPHTPGPGPVPAAALDGLRVTSCGVRFPLLTAPADAGEEVEADSPLSGGSCPECESPLYSLPGDREECPECETVVLHGPALTPPTGEVGELTAWVEAMADTTTSIQGNGNVICADGQFVLFPRNPVRTLRALATQAREAEGLRARVAELEGAMREIAVAIDAVSHAREQNAAYPSRDALEKVARTARAAAGGEVEHGE